MYKMSGRMKVAFGCYLLVTLGIGIIGLIYLFRTEFMPYHAVAVGHSWEEVDSAFQILLLALIRAFGGASFSAAVAMGIILFVPFRRGTQWARWSILAIGYTYYVPALIATLSVTLNTPATPPWKFIVMGMVVLLIGLILSLESGKKIEMIVDRSVA